MRKQFFNLLKGTGIVLALATCIVSCKKDVSRQTQQPITLAQTPAIGPSAKATTLQLVWSDEFNGTSVDQSKWNIDVGNPNVNHELESYQTANLTESGGNLVITAKQQNVGDGQPYTSGKMNTSGKFSVQYGRIEARIQLPMVTGTWPAFWMLGTDIGSVGWPNCGEIDIMEHVNTTNTILGTMHWNGGSGHVQYGGSTTTTPGTFHVYAVEWDNTGIRWFVDNNLYVTGNTLNNINNTGAFQLPFYIILNLAMGGDLPGNTIDNASLPTTMLVDYVRVYKFVNSSGPPIGQTITLKGSNNLYVSGENGTQAMNCNRTTAQAWEQFLVVDAGNGKVELQSMSKYVSSENGTMPITCNRTTAGGWEQFTWVTNSDGSISLQGSNGKFVSSENGTQAMTCNRTTAGAWEDFRVNQ
jgi:beta-glucanase (GH16 family)